MSTTDVVQQLAEVPGIEEDTLLAAGASANAAAALRPASGLYQRSSPAVLPSADGESHDLMPLPTSGLAEAGMREDLRLDIDGSHPQNVVSGTIYRALNSRVDWVAKVAPSGVNTWTGTVWYKNGDLGAFPYTNIKVQVIRSGSLAPFRAKVIFSGGGIPNAERTFAYKSPYYHPVEFEFDYVQGVAPATQMRTHDHPNRPSNLPSETLTIPRVFQRMGFDVRVSAGGNPIPISGAGSNARWSDMEMHDAMQQYWSRFANRAQWAMWVFFAALHEQGSSLGGIMFDDIGGNHRQGTAIFTNSFISTAPAGDPAPDAWVKRMKFWCAIHEMGHAFNLAHSWQKALGTPWVPLANEPEARSFMNYPYNVAGGQTAFFSNFQYRFSNAELLFMRHAPERFVQMGNADWFDHHGFEQANTLPEATFQLDLRVQRKQAKGALPTATYEFMEPVVLELKLKNVSGRPQVVPATILSPSHHLTVIIKRRGRPARELVPFATYCWEPDYLALAPGESMYESLFASVGQEGWDIAEPGYYTIQTALHLETEDLVSNPLVIRVAPPLDYQEEYLSQDYFSDDVGRILTFDGSHVLDAGNQALNEIVEKLPDRKVALHARIAQANALMRDYKSLALNGADGREMQSAADSGGTFKVKKADLDRARELYEDVLEKPAEAAESLGNIDLNYYLTRFSDAVAETGEAGAMTESAEVLGALSKGLAARKVPDWVTNEVDGRQAAKSAAAGKGAASKAKRKRRPK